MKKIIILILALGFIFQVFCQDTETDLDVDAVAVEETKPAVGEASPTTGSTEEVTQIKSEEEVKIDDTDESEVIGEKIDKQSSISSEETTVEEPKIEESKAQEKKIDVVLGLDSNIDLPFVPDRQVQIGEPGVLAYEFLVGRKEITLKGLKPGLSSVTLRDSADPDARLTLVVTVRTNPQSKVLLDIQTFLKDIEGIEIKVIGDTITLDGFLVIPDDIGRILYILEKYPDIVNLVELSPQTQREVAKKMQEEIHAAGMRQVNVRIIHKTFVLEGVVSSNDEKAKASKIAALFLPDRIQSLAKRKGGIETVPRSIIQDFISVNEKKDQPPLPKLVKITAQFVELTKSFSDIFGFEWSPWLGGTGGEIKLGKTSGGLATNSNGTLSAVISDLFPKLSSAQNAGHARVIQSSVLIVKEDVVGTIQKTIESVNPIGSGEFQKSQTSKGGYQLEVKPKILKDENIDLEIVMNSDTISGRSQEEIETLKNNVKTTLVVKSKESAVIGGVFDKKDETKFNTPQPQTAREGGGQKLFSFIRGKTNVVSKAQFVMFITPEIIASASSGAEEIKKKFRRRK